MVSESTQHEIEEYLGQVPSFVEAIADPAADHAWAMLRDLELAETDLTAREKALVGMGAASAIQCPYCVHFHNEHAKLEGIGEAEREEAHTLASSVRYFSTALHGAEVSIDEFEEETTAIMNHVEQHQAAAGDD